LIGTKKRDGTYTKGYVDKLVKNGTITKSEADQVRKTLGEPVKKGEGGKPDQYAAGTAIARIAARPTKCSRGAGQTLDVTYEIAVVFSLIFVVLEEGEKEPDPDVIAHEQGHVDIAEAVAGEAGSTTGNEPISSSTDRKKRKKEIDEGKAKPITDEDNPPADLHKKLRNAEDEKTKRDGTYDSPGYTGGTKSPKDLTPEQRKELGLK
jgi:hypothetical protein